MTTKYKLIDHPNGFHDDHWCVEIEEGTFKGVVYQYDHQSILFLDMVMWILRILHYVLSF